METEIQDVSLSENLENWMGNLPDKLKDIPIIHLAIPGSHDSMTYSMTTQSPVSPDADGVVKKLSILGWPAKVVIHRWSVTQLADTNAQLAHGIRYLDLRVATKYDNNKRAFYFCHGLYCHRVNDTLNDIRDFLRTHPNEVVILDFQHFYNFDQTAHTNLLDLLADTFKDSLFPFPYNFAQLTLATMTRDAHQVIVVYRANDIRAFCCPSVYFPTPWGETTSVTQLLAFLNRGLDKRDLGKGFVSQCLLTPTVSFVIRHLFKTLVSTCVLPMRYSVLQWLSGQTPGVSGRLNVSIVDFVELNNWQFCRNVVDLNKKLLDDDDGNG